MRTRIDDEVALDMRGACGRACREQIVRTPVLRIFCLKVWIPELLGVQVESASGRNVELHRSVIAVEVMAHVAQIGLITERGMNESSAGVDEDAVPSNTFRKVIGEYG